MELKDVIHKRRATRQYKQEAVDEEILLDLLMRASMGPSKGNTHPVEFLIIEDQEKKRRLAKIKKFGTKYLSRAPQIIAVLGNDNAETTWVEEASIAASYLGLLLTDAGYQSGWINIRGTIDDEGRDAEGVVRELFDIPESYGVLCLIPFGPSDERHPRRKAFDISSKVHKDTF